MLVKTKGLVLRCVNYSETSIVATIYTSELGLRSYMLKGVRKSKNKQNGNIYQPLQVLDLNVYEQANKQLQYIKEAKIDFLFQNLRFDIRKTAIGLFILELVYSTVKELEPNPELFELIVDQLTQLDEQEQDFQQAHLQFMLALSQYLGFLPHNNFNEQNHLFALQDGQFVSPKDIYPHCLNVNDSEIFHRFLSQKKPINRLERNRVLELLERYYQFHVPGFTHLKTPEIFQEIFS